MQALFTNMSRAVPTTNGSLHLGWRDNQRPLILACKKPVSTWTNNIVSEGDGG